MIKKYYAADLIPATAVVIIGIAELAHLCGIFLNRPLYFCAMVFGGLSAVALLAALAVLIYRVSEMKKTGQEKAVDRKGRGLFFLFLLIVLSQLFFILTNENLYRTGDMTVETVNSFLQTDGFYQVNPLTGQAYVQGIPSRLKVLGLPTLYASLCRLIPVLSPDEWITRVVPCLVLVCCYASYAALGQFLFQNDQKKRNLFLVAVALVLWAGCACSGLDGFNILYSGWRGASIRNALLLPWGVSLSLRKRWFPVALCVIAEACIVWTLYGLGACLLTAAGIGVTDLVLRRTFERRARIEKTGEGVQR
jgi:hypothetical protein